MKSKLLYLIVAFLITACESNVNRESKPPEFNQEAQTIEVNTDEGYTVNSLTGDTIQPFLNSLGDTIKTGVPIPAKGHILHSDSLAEPEMVKIPNQAKLTANSAHQNVQKIADQLTKLTVKEDMFTELSVPEIDTSNYIINSIGDTLPTGIPVPANGKKLDVIHPGFTKGLLPARKDEATVDLQYLDVDQGLNSSFIFSMLEDRNGNLWLGSNGGGLTKYDGVNFTHYTEKEGLNNNYVVSMLEDQDGNLWFGTNGGGACKYDGKSFIHFTDINGLGSQYVFSIIEDQNGNIWFGTYGGGISKYDGDSFTHYTVNEGLSANTVRSMIEDDQGNIWIGTWGGGLNKFDGKTFTHFKQKDGFSSNYFLSAMKDQKGNLWFGTWGGGAAKYDGTSFTFYTNEIGLGSNIIMAMQEDQNGNIWFCTNDAGITKFDGKYFTHYTEKEGLTNNYVASILEDKSGGLWFGTNGGGINIYNGNSFSHFRDKEGLSRSTIFSIAEDKNQNMWFGTYGGGVNRYHDSTFTHYTTKEGLVHNTILSMMVDESGNVWFGTNGSGVSKYDGGSFINYKKNQGLSGNTVYSILEAKNGDLWFGTNRGGATKYDGKSFVHFTDKNGLTGNSIRSILEDREGNIWFGTYGGGVCMYNGESFTNFTEKEGLSDNIVLSIAEDSDGNLWFGTYAGGINKFDGESFTYYTEEQGLSSNTIWSIQEDKNSNLWLSTEEGINVMNPDHSTEKDGSGIPEVLVFDKNDGLKDLKFYHNSVCLDRDNNIWWGSGKSLTRLNIDEFEIAKEPPMVKLSQLNIQGRFVDFQHMNDSVKEDIDFSGVQRFDNYPLNLELPYDHNHLTFYFSAIDWSAPHKIKYSYMMEGLNTNWSVPGQEAKADYRNLSHGTYTFKVRAIGESGEWSQPFEYEFTIYPPWWHTWYARTVYGLVFLFLIFGTVRWRTTKLKRRQKELEKEVDAATQEIRQQKNEAEKQRDEVSKQKEVIEIAHKEIRDSINYAKRIQGAILPPRKLVKEYLPESFILYKPKDIVAGDFFWMEPIKEGVLFAAADCTGHGVPGAMVSVVCNNGLNRSVREHGIKEPAKILDKTREIVIEEFEKSEEEVQDGMDIALCSLKDVGEGKSTLEFAGAHNPLWIIRKGATTIEEIKGDKQPIGKFGMQKPFTNHRVTLNEGDTIYLFSDGFADQFGGKRGKKYKSANFKKLLLSISSSSMIEQKELIDQAFESWKGNNEQLDDVCVIGLRV